ncbi:MAG: hypothetical protein A2039_02660 [Candidatus Melainabacteria bacterium GWA2_34_9]|nr:MAG: hypothetical protein A2039_02660 [Candidatus Melainabacteria bacterium GWA2_34_9]
MKIADLDYYATFGNTFLHKVPVKLKLFDIAIILISALFIKNIYTLGVIYAFLLLILMFSGIPRLKTFKISLYPLIFASLFLFSVNNLTLPTALNLIFKVLCISTSFAILILTTSYIQIFKAMSGFLPDIMVNILFNTYRSLFIINNTLDNLLTTVRLRGGVSIFRPVYSLKTIGNLVGFFVIKSIETSEKMYEGLKLRGYSDKVFCSRD